MDQFTLGLDPLPKKTCKEVFLDEMNQVVPWAALVAFIAPFARGAHQALGGRPPFPIETMLRIHCLQLWWNMSDPAMEEELHERPWYRRFAGLDGAARMPKAERLKASVRAKVEHPFRAIKQQFGYAKVRYRGLQKNTARLMMLFAMSNLWMARKRIMGAQG